MELTAEELWSRIAQEARDVLPEQTFRTWLSSTEAVSLSDDKLVVGAKTRFAAEWIEDKYGALLHDIAQRQLGRPLSLRFEQRGGDDRLDFPEIRAPDAADRGAAGEGRAEAGAGARFGARLNQRYTFDRFVIGSNNQLAAAACQRVGAAPAQAYNPLFIYGAAGLGKTHLMHAIGHAILRDHHGLTVAYLPSEQFTNEMIAAIQSGRTADFRRRYRQIDILLIDDVQFIGNKEGTQEEFFHTFNSLYDAQKQIVITSDRPPAEIEGLQERLVSRFEWGLVTDIKPPDFETRTAILRNKAMEDGLEIGDDIIDHIARNRRNSVRELEGALIKLLACSSLTRREISLALAKEAITTDGGGDGEPPERASPDEVRRAAAEAWGVTVEGLTSKRRTRALTVPRQVAMYLIKTNLDLPYSEIGQLFGGRDHSTVIHSVNKVEASMASDPSLRVRVRRLQQELFDA